MSSDYEVVQRIADIICDHDILDHPSTLWKCRCCEKWGQGMKHFAHHLAAELVDALGLGKEHQWIPTFYGGTEGASLPTWHDADAAMVLSNEVSRVDREFRIVSDWVRPGGRR